MTRRALFAALAAVPLTPLAHSNGLLPLPPAVPDEKIVNAAYILLGVLLPGESASKNDENLALFHLASLKTEFPGESPSRLSVRLAARMQPAYPMSGLEPFGPQFSRPIAGIRVFRDDLFVTLEDRQLYVLNEEGTARCLSMYGPTLEEFHQGDPEHWDILSSLRKREGPVTGR